MMLAGHIDIRRSNKKILDYHPRQIENVPPEQILFCKFNWRFNEKGFKSDTVFLKKRLNPPPPRLIFIKNVNDHLGNIGLKYLFKNVGRLLDICLVLWYCCTFH